MDPALDGLEPHAPSMSLSAPLRSSSVHHQELERPGPVLGAWAGVAPGGLNPGVAQQLGDDHEVGAAPDQGGGEGVPKDVGCDEDRNEK